MRKIFIICIVLCAAGLFAQQVRWGRSNAFKPAAVASSAPSWAWATNLPNLAAAYVPVFYTNSSGYITNWPDQWTNGWNLTASAESRMPFITNNVVNGYPIARFDGSSDYLTNWVASLPQPHETWMVVRYFSSDVTTARVLSDATTVAQAYMRVGSGTLFLYAGTYLSRVMNEGYRSDFTNKYVVFAGGFASTASYIQTNSAVAVVGNAGSSTQSGITVGTYGAFGDYAPIATPMILYFSNTNTELQRSNIFWNITNYFAL